MIRGQRTWLNNAESAGAHERDADSDGRALDVRAVARGGSGDEAVVELLLDELRRTRATVEGELAKRKDAALAAMREAGFWEDDARHAVLGEVEYLDRLEAAFDTARKLGRRLEAAAGKNGRGGTSELAGLLALRLHVLSAAIEGIARANAPDVFLRLRVAAETDAGRGAAWIETLAAMYSSWAERRGMRIRRLDDHEHEHADGRQSPLDRATRSLAERTGAPGVVRRYRRDPSPLVRDALRGYRTGRLDRVLAGDFDLY